MKSLINIENFTLRSIVEALLCTQLSIRTIIITILHLSAYMRIWNNPIAYVHRINIYDIASIPDVIFTINQSFEMMYDIFPSDFEKEISYFTKYKEYEDVNGINRFIDLVVFTKDLEYIDGHELQIQIEYCFSTVGSDVCGDCYDAMKTLILHKYNNKCCSVMSTDTLINFLYKLFYQDSLRQLIYKNINIEKKCINLATNISILVNDYLLGVQ